MKLKITIISSSATIMATYLSNKLKRIEFATGTLSVPEYHHVTEIIPRHLTELAEFERLYNEKIIYQKVEQKSKTIFKELMDQYHSWYLKRTGIAPKIDGVSGKHLKQLITHLRKQCMDDNEVIAVFATILNHWKELPDFYQSQMELRQINSNINIILNTLKNGKSDSKSKAQSVSNDFRKSL